MNKVINALQYVRYDVLYDEGNLICSIPNIEFGYYQTEINDSGELIIDIEYAD